MDEVLEPYFKSKYRLQSIFVKSLMVKIVKDENVSNDTQSLNW